MKYFTDALKKYAKFSGRSSRKEYWMYILFYVMFYIVAGIIDSVIGTPVLTPLYFLVLLIPGISIAARRLHDTGRSGWWQLIALIPFGVIVLIIFLVLSSDRDNEYGPVPAPA